MTETKRDGDKCSDVKREGSSICTDEMIRLANSGMFEPNHPTTKLTIGYLVADIDQLLVPLIEHLWSEGILTLQSCQGGVIECKLPDGVNCRVVSEGYITFRDKSSLINFNDRILQSGDHQLYTIDVIDNGSLIQLSTDQLMTHLDDGSQLFSIRFSTESIDPILDRLLSS